ncbi:MAG: hypothetical protein AAF667_06575 [Pseudomonadota bacterium]
MTEPVYEFEQLIQSDRVLPNGVFLVSDRTGHALWFDRTEPDCKSELRAFLDNQAKARVIMASDVTHWSLWLMDEGRDSVSTTRKNQNPDPPAFCDWQGLDFAGH